MPGGSSTTTQNTQSQPLKEVRPLLNTAFSDALRAYKGGVGSQPYTGSTVVPQSQQTQQGYKGIMQSANQNANGRNGLNSNLQDIISNGGFNDAQSGALGNMQNQLKQLGGNGLSGAQDDALANYRKLANSSYDFNANPGSQGVLDAALRDQSNAVNLNAAASGRYGSGIHEGVLAQKAGDLSNTFRYGDYNNWLGRKDNANAGMASLGQQGVQNRQGLSGNIFNAGQSGLGNMTQAYTAQQSPYQNMLGVGAANEDLYKRTMDDKLRVYDAQNNAPWTQIQKLLAAAGGGGSYGSQSTTATAPGANPFLSTLGGTASGLSSLNTILGLL
jgi:hypothetical protein